MLELFPWIFGVVTVVGGGAVFIWWRAQYGIRSGRNTDAPHAPHAPHSSRTSLSGTSLSTPSDQRDTSVNPAIFLAAQAMLHDPYARSHAPAPQDAPPIDRGGHVPTPHTSDGGGNGASGGDAGDSGSTGGDGGSGSGGGGGGGGSGGGD